jgi:pimeloyl-ACP methyl ester carboxylesterase
MNAFVSRVLYCVTLAACAAALQVEAQESPAEQSVLERFPAPGRMIDVGGRQLHLHCTGTGAGPTVIIETGAAASSVLYWNVQDGIAPFARVCTYDRAGLGWSDPAPAGRTMQDRADELHIVLTRAQIAPPYVLVGHSMGGLLVRLFARDHRADIAAIVLVDASEEVFSLVSSSGSQGNAQTAVQLGQLAGAAQRLSAAEFQKLLASTLPLPPGAPAAAAITQRVSVLLAGKDDLESFQRVPQSLHGPAGFGRLGDLPLVVIRRGKMATPPTARDLAWRESQQRLLQLSTASVEIIATNSGHNIHLQEPGIIVDAVRRVHAAARETMR